MTTETTRRPITLSELPAAVLMNSYPDMKSFRRAVRNLAKQLGTEYQVQDGAYLMYIGQYLYRIYLNETLCTWWDIVSD